MNLEEAEPFIYNTPMYPTREQCWEDLGEYLQMKDKIGWIWLRVAPEVNSETDFDTKETRHQGFVRGWVVPNSKTLNLNRMVYE